MFCFVCGKEISDAANVCPYCGKPQREGVQLPQEQPVQPQQPQAQPYQQSVQVQQPNTVMQQVSGFIDRLTGGNFMKNFKITTFVAAGLNVLLLILWFAPIFKLNGTTWTRGLPGLEFSFPDLFKNEAVKDAKYEGYDVGMNTFMFIISAISVITIIMPLIKKKFEKAKLFIFSKICAVIYGGLVIMQLTDTNNQLSKFSSSISLDLNFWGVLYMLCAIAVIVVTILMTMQMKKNNSLVTGGF